ncbi:hypothetical protein EV699_10250 [Plasticicumulans lactativorans]|uniref:Uncharacterized protein n=1 Tax=Plasticicumulans lactativorans TaxID=1133106 RepID=A0A4R2L8E5_9GAMM|nr:hypothetical protein [Plasticicumulans lactativorans]TCO83352.1 hypothetical protein EV699_10250 [Plasticicumulans lactativorans]
MTPARVVLSAAARARVAALRLHGGAGALVLDADGRLHAVGGGFTPGPGHVPLGCAAGVPCYVAAARYAALARHRLLIDVAGADGFACRAEPLSAQELVLLRRLPGAGGEGAA